MKLSGTVFFQQIFLSLAVEALSWPGQYERDWWWRGGGFGRLWFWLVWWVTINYSPVQPGWWSAKDPNSIRITLHVQYEFGQYESVIYDKAVVAFSRWPSTNHLSDQSGEPQPSVEWKPTYKLKTTTSDPHWQCHGCFAEQLFSRAGWYLFQGLLRKHPFASFVSRTKIITVAMKSEISLHDRVE